MSGPSFRYMTEHKNELGILKSRFTNEKHAKDFARHLKREGIEIKIYLIDAKGNKGPEVKFR